MQLPDRVRVPTCIGCGAMSVFGTCDRGCSEEKLELVRAIEYDRLKALAGEAPGRVEAFLTVIQELACRHPGPTEWESAYRSAQDAARRTLRRYLDLEKRSQYSDPPSEIATTWWCARCGGIDAPQPCLGICVWRSIDWVNVKLYEQERTRAVAEGDTERRCRWVLQRAACVTPRQHQWERGWHVLQAQAQETLALL